MYKFGAKQAFECAFVLEASADPDCLDPGLTDIAIGRRYFTPLFCSHLV